MSRDRGGRRPEEQEAGSGLATGVRLAPGVRLDGDKEKDGVLVLVCPNGKVQLNRIAAAILRLCDGSRDREDVVAEVVRRSQPADARGGDHRVPGRGAGTRLDRRNVKRASLCVVATSCGFCIGSAATCAMAAAPPPLEEVVVVAPYGTAVDPALVPANVQRAIAEQLQRSQSLDLTDFLNRQFSSVSINHAQNNPLQPDFNFRGFTASPLLGLPQGLSVYQNGVRINDPFGDTVNWDLIPMSAIDSVQLLAGAQPVFGLNTLGGALSMQMKNGFSYQGTQAEVYDGSFGRLGAIDPGRRQRRTLGLLRRRRLSSRKMAGATIRSRRRCACTVP